MNQLADKVVAYHLPEDGDEEMYGLCIRREGDTLRVMVLQKDDNREMPLRSVLRKLSDEDGIVNSLEGRFGLLQTKLAKERSAGARSKNYRLQETMLQWAAHRLEGVDAEEWRRLAQEHCPSAVAKAVGCAAASIATDAKLVSSAWSDAQQFFLRGKDLVADIRQIGERRMSQSLYSSLEEGYISDSSLSYASVAQESPFLSILHKWITALVDYQRVRYMEDGEAELQQQLSGCLNSLQSAKERRGSLMEQAELINAGNCYIRTQAVHSVPIECVLYLMTAEKVTTRQYLLKETASLESLDEVLSRPAASARSARGSRQEDALGRSGLLSARTADVPPQSSNCTNAGVQIPSLPIPKVESGRVGTWVGGRFVRRQRTPETKGDGNAAGIRSRDTSAHHMGSAAAILKASPRYAFAPAAMEAVESDVETRGSASHAGRCVEATAALPLSSSSSAPAPTAPPTRVEGKQRMEPASQGTAAVSAHAGPEQMQVLADVRNNFKNVQTVLLGCLEDYQKLEDKYASTVENSKQLLQALEDRDQLIERLQEDLVAATRAPPPEGDGWSGLHAGCVNGAARHRDLDDMYVSASETLYSPNTVGGDADPNSFEHRFEQMLYDTLEFLQGAEPTRTIYENETNRA